MCYIDAFRNSFFLIVVSSIFLLGSCNTGEIAALPDPPASAKQVEALVKEKKFSVKELGFYGDLTIQEKTNIEWIDSSREEDRMIKKVWQETANWSLEFGKDSSGTVLSDGLPCAARWWVDDRACADESPGIRLRCSYKDPRFTFGASQPMELTFSYVVKGISDSQLLLELPRDINRRKLVALMEVKP